MYKKYLMEQSTLKKDYLTTLYMNAIQIPKHPQESCSVEERKSGSTAVTWQQSSTTFKIMLQEM